MRFWYRDVSNYKRDSFVQLVGVLLMLSMGVAQAQHGSAQSLLPDYDIRKGEFSTYSFTADNQKAAVSQLKSAAPSVQLPGATATFLVK